MALIQGNSETNDTTIKNPSFAPEEMAKEELLGIALVLGGLKYEW